MTTELRPIDNYTLEQLPQVAGPLLRPQAKPNRFDVRRRRRPGAAPLGRPAGDGQKRPGTDHLPTNISLKHQS